MMPLFESLQNSGLAAWIKSETLFPYTFFIALHALGMGVLVGLNAAVDLRILGFAPRLPLAPMAATFPFMWAGFWVNLVSGVALFIAEPVRAVTNPVFFLKLGGVALAVVILRRLRRQLFGDPASVHTKPVPMNGKVLAGTSLFAWLGTITAGRLMAYHGVTGVEWGTVLALVVVTGVLLLAGYLAVQLGWSKLSRA